MTHSDDKGLVLPPKLAPFQVVIVPIYKNEEQLALINELAAKMKKAMEAIGITVKYDNRDTQRPGWKFAEYELKGVPVRIAIGGRDLENGTVEVARRDTMEKETLQQIDLENKIAHILEQMQDNLYKKALSMREAKTYTVDTYEEFKRTLEETPGFIMAHWDGTPETEQKIKEETKATIRCIPLAGKLEQGKCIYSGNLSAQRVVFAKAY
jgi:prolyl-tRNA synthetase